MRQSSSFLKNRISSRLAAVLLLMVLIVCSLDSLAEADLTGIWSCDDGGLYYIRQIGETVWWYGEQSSPNPAFSNVATGTIDGNTVNLNWVDVPKGGTTSSGTLVLNIESSDELTAVQKTGGFGGSTWTRTTTGPAVSTAQPGPSPSSPQSSPTSTSIAPGMGPQLLDHAMGNNVDESSSEIITRTAAFSASDGKAYSWLSLGNVGTSKVEWMWYSPDNNRYATSSHDIPAPTSGDHWDTYKIFDSIQIAGFNAANLPGNWHVDVYIDGQKLLTEQFTLGTSGSGTPQPQPGSPASAPVSPGMGTPTPTVPGTSTAGPTTQGANGSLASLMGLDPNDPTLIELF